MKTNVKSHNKNHKKISVSELKENDFPYIREIKDLNELNAQGCRYILSANHKNYTRIITRSMRWLTVRQGDHFMSPEQDLACRRINALTFEKTNQIDRNLNLHILLDKDPRCLTGELYDDSYIKKLILIGADVRFEDRDSKMKLVL